MTSYALSTTIINQKKGWVIDSGATCHMCNDDKLFVEIRCLKQPQEVTLGDGHVLEATGVGVVELQATLGNGKTKGAYFVMCSMYHNAPTTYSVYHELQRWEK